MPFSNPAEREQEIFGPDTVAVLAAALENAVRQLRLVDRNDPADQPRFSGRRHP